MKHYRIKNPKTGLYVSKRNYETKNGRIFTGSGLTQHIQHLQWMERTYKRPFPYKGYELEIVNFVPSTETITFDEYISNSKCL